MTLSISDLTGREVMRMPYNALRPEIDLGRMPDGLYLLSIYSNNRVIGCSRLVKE